MNLKMDQFTTRSEVNTSWVSVFIKSLCRDSAALMTKNQATVNSCQPSKAPLLPAGSAAALTQTEILKGGKYSWKSRHLLQVILQLLQHGFQLRHFLFQVPRRVTASETQPQPLRHHRWVFFSFSDRKRQKDLEKTHCLHFPYWLFFSFNCCFKLKKRENWHKDRNKESGVTGMHLPTTLMVGRQSSVFSARKTHLSFKSFSLPSVRSPAWEGSPALRSERGNTNDIINAPKAARAGDCWALKGGRSEEPHSGRTHPGLLVVS